jgi:hypothetical protein
MLYDAVMFCLIVDVPTASLPHELPEDQLFFIFNMKLLICCGTMLKL